MDQYQDIREMYIKEGMSQRAIARALKISRNTVRRYCQGQNVPWERKRTERPPSVITAEVVEFIKSCLEEDARSPRKQRHTAQRIYDRLCDEKGFTGGASTICHAVRELRDKIPRVYVPLAFDPGEGHEKGLVENLVGFCRRNFLVPIPEVKSFEELNTMLQQRCLRYIEHHQVRGRELSVKEAFVLEQKALLPLPFKPYDARKSAEPRVDYFATVRFETNCYSVPVKWAGKRVNVKGSGLKVHIYYRGEEIASHTRCYKKYKTIYELEHYLPLIEQRPRSVFHARPVKEANLPEEISGYALKTPDPDKTMVRLLRLIIDHGIEIVLKAIKNACNQQHYSFEIIQYSICGKSQSPRLSITGPIVNPVDMSIYDQLLTGGVAI